MDWIDRLNLSLEYIESNLDKTIELSKASGIACCSVYHYQRIFSLIAGISLGEYIRNRRLTLAGYDLQNSSVSVIDVGLKYGYQSPTSFTRAFSKLHGITPKQAKHHGSFLKSYPKFSFQIMIGGQGELQYRIEEKPTFRLIGIKETVYNDGINNFIRIPKMWQEAHKKGKVEEIFKLSNGTVWGVMGALSNYTDDSVDYYIASTSDEPIPKGMEELHVEAGLWVIFSCYGSESIQPIWKRIYGEWFPMSGYEYSGGTEIEWYSDGELDASNYLTEIWIPIKKERKK